MTLDTYEAFVAWFWIQNTLKSDSRYISHEQFRFVT